MSKLGEHFSPEKETSVEELRKSAEPVGEMKNNDNIIIANSVHHLVFLRRCLLDHIRIS